MPKTTSAAPAPDFTASRKAASAAFLDRAAANADADVIEAALLLSLGVAPAFVAAQLPPGDRERVLNRAADGGVRDFSLHGLMDATIRRAGRSHHGGRASDSFARAAIEADRTLSASGGASTVSLSGILANVANKVMLARYESQNTTWDKIAAVRSHSDFKAVSRYRMDSTGAFKKVGPDGELKHVGLQDSSYANKLDTYAAMIALTRVMMVNDDLNAFAAVPGSLGDMAAIRVEEGAYTLLLSNAGAFFSASNRNLLTGVGSAFGEAGVTAAETAYLNQVDANGKPIFTNPSVLLVPSGLKVPAEKLYKGTTLIATGLGPTPAVQSAANPHAGKYPPVVSPYLDNAAIRDQDNRPVAGQSATAWYLFCDPAARAAVAVAFLDGQRLPTIEPGGAEFDTLGIQWRGYLDVGFGFEDPTAALKAAGS